jgi:lysozyme
MILGERGKKLIKSYETLRLVAYMPTPNDRPTIGWGHTKGVKAGDTCTAEQAEKWFLEDTAEAVAAVHQLIDTLEESANWKGFTQSMFDALVSLAYNAGPGSVAVGNTIEEALVRGDYYAACEGFFAYRKQTNKKTGKKENVRGLALRRTREMGLFLEDKF